MYNTHEGEIVIKEKYCTSIQRYYVRPPDQENIVLVDKQSTYNVTNLFMRVFLPHGYPDSVSKDYIKYQTWDTAQAFCSTITGILATQEVLRGVGVGDTNATPMAATITWVLKDGCGHLGRILFAYSHGTYLDAYSKKWRLYADTLNDAAMCMEIALPVFKNYTTFVLCTSTMMKAIVGVAGGATRVAMTQHHAVRGNMADVSAKDSAQETAVNLIASMTALLIITTIGNSVMIFILMIGLHIVFNYFAVRAVCLRTINEPRFLQIIDTYLNKEVISTPCDINKNEPLVFYQLGTNLLDLKLCGFKILLGQSIKKVVQANPKANYLKNVEAIYRNQNYIIFPHIDSRKMYVVVRDVATTDDILCAYFHAVLLSIVICSINDVPLSVLSKIKSTPFVNVCRTLEEADWSRETLNCPCDKFKYGPSIELMAFLFDVVQKEWNVMKMGLDQTGWNMQKHLLIVDEWRVATHTITSTSPLPNTRLIPLEKLTPTAMDGIPNNKLNLKYIGNETCIIEPERNLSIIQDTKPEKESDLDEKNKTADDESTKINNCECY